MPSEFHLYPKIKCPYCGFFTTAAEKLGPHMVDKHPKEVIKGVHKVRTPKKAARTGKKAK